MKNHYLILLLFLFLSFKSFSQVEVPIKTTLKGFITESVPPYDYLKVSFEGQVDEFFSYLLLTDSTLIFKTKSEASAYGRLLSRYQTEVNKKTKAESKGTKIKDSAKELEEPDISQYLDEREILKPGIEVEVTFDKYTYSKKNVITQILIKTDFNSTVKINGLFEKLEGNVATIDGQTVSLREGVSLVGKSGFEGKTFSSFKDMMYGMEIDAKGKRMSNGVLEIESGTVVENEFSDVDRKIATSYKNIMKRSANEEEINIADTLTLQVLTNITIQTYVNRVANAVIPAYIKKLPEGTPGKIDFSFLVIKDQSFNACAYPDGTIHIYTGLLEKIENDAQLATIIGHEIAHVVYKHSRKNYEKQKTQLRISEITALGQVLGVKGADIATVATALGGPILLSNYSRDFEEQADRIGLTYLYEAGYDPREAPKIWRMLAHEADDELPSGSLLEAVALKGSKKIRSIYSSHPEAEKRYRNLSLLIAQNYQESDLSGLKVGAEGYQSMKATLKRVLKGLPEKQEVRAEVPQKKVNTPEKQPAKATQKTPPKTNTATTKNPPKKN